MYIVGCSSRLQQSYSIVSVHKANNENLLIVVASVLLHGVNAGSYRRVVEARGTATVEQNQTVYGILSDCYDIPLFDLCTRARESDLRTTAYPMLSQLQIALAART